MYALCNLNGKLVLLCAYMTLPVIQNAVAKSMPTVRAGPGGVQRCPVAVLQAQMDPNRISADGTHCIYRVLQLHENED